MKARVKLLEAARPATTVTVTPGDGTATVKWTPVPGATGYKVGYGTWEITEPATARTRTITGLANGAERTVFVQPLPVGIKVSVKVTPAAPIIPAKVPSVGYAGGY